MALATSITHFPPFQALAISREVTIPGPIIKQFSSQELIVAIDKLFAQSIALDATSIIDFIRALCAVSLEELEAPVPRMFCLQRIVEISYYNMSRIRLEWGSIWQALRPYFNTVGCNVNSEIAGFAVDSLKQLAMKFLEKSELAHYHTQNEFLKPFEYIVSNNGAMIIREMVVQSLSNIVMSRASNIRSGWRSILVTLTKIARFDHDPQIINASFGIIQMIVEHSFATVSTSLVDLVSTIVEYMCLSNSDNELNQNALNCLQQVTTKLLEMEITDNDPYAHVADHKAEQKSTVPVSPPPPMSEEMFFLRWFPLLSGYSRVISDSKSPTLRARSVDLLFSLLKTHAGKFSGSLWRIILRTVLVPIFEDLSHPQLRRTDASSVVWIQALRQCVDLYTSLNACFPEVDFLKEFLRLANIFVGQNNENLAQTGAICFHQLVWKNFTGFRSQDWDEIATALEHAFDATNAKELLVPLIGDSASGNRQDQENPPGETSSDNPQIQPPFSQLQEYAPMSRRLDTKIANAIDFSHAIVKCAIQLIMIQSVKDISLTERESAFDLMPYGCQMRWLECLRKSYALARDFNANYMLRLQLWKSGFVPQMPNLIKQETSAAATYISLLFRLYKREVESESWLKCTMFELILEVTERYTHMLQDSEKHRKELATWAPMIVIILDELVQLNWELDRDLFSRVQELFQLSLLLMNAEDANIRASLQKFLGKIGGLYLKQENAPSLPDS
jgi:brefeldin A-inhibited guanine nucleotide-exchange protein